jgi:hypothetical protein
VQVMLMFKGELEDTDEIVVQYIPISDPEILKNPLKLAATAQVQLVQLGLGGMVHLRDNVMTLIPGKRFKEIRVELPSLVIATSGEIPIA